MSISDPPPRTGQLSVDAPGASIKVLDAFLRLVEGGAGTDRVTIGLAPGAYRVIARIGAREVTEPVLIRATGPPRAIRLSPRFDAAAPVDGSATANESHGELTRQLTDGPPGPARLVVILRGLRGRPMAPLSATDAAVTPVVHDALGARLTLAAPTQDPYQSADKKNRALGWTFEVQPGGCRVRWHAPQNGQDVEQALWVPPGCQTILFVPQSPKGPVPAAASVHILPMTTQWQPWEPDTVAVETTLAGLRGRSRRPQPDTWKRVLDRAESPLMLTLLTLHEMVRAVGSEVPTELEQSAFRALDHLRSAFGASPDVAALVATIAPEQLEEPVSWPPMLRAAHELLLAAADRGEAIRAGSFAELVTGQTFTSAPWNLYDPAGLDVALPPPDVTPPIVAIPDPASLPKPRRRGTGRLYGTSSTRSGELGGGMIGIGVGGTRDDGLDIGQRRPVETGLWLPIETESAAPQAVMPTPSPIAVDRVRELLGTMAAGPGYTTPADPADVAERLRMTPSLAQSCMRVLGVEGT